MTLIRLVKWKGEEKEPFPEEHKHDYKWIENREERLEWIKKYWEIKYE